MFPYNRKIWAYDPSELAAQWMGERVATVDLSRVLRNLVRKKDDVSWGPNATFRFPARRDRRHLARACARLPQNKVHLGRKAVGINTAQRTLQFADGQTVDYDALISTMPVDRLLSISDRPDLGKISAQLKHSSTHVVGVGMQGQPPPSLATKCWIYFPEPEFPFYRVTVFSNYSSNNVPKPGQQWLLMAEVSESPQKAGDYAAVVEQVVAGLRLAKLIPLGADVCSTWHRRLEYGYPTPSRDREAILEELQPNLEAMGIYSRGRFGAWKYEVSNQDHCLMQGIEAVDQILLGAEETTLRFPAIVNAGKIAGRTWRNPFGGRPQ